ncbi:MAG: TetR/AcrR family transcriptional regulator [Marinilabiliales bacterium]|nr:MAG: TetR/AcrR family transcriptional regulator [Marinilabiliales bacterium]
MDIRDKIIAEAGKLFMANGVKKIKMDTIAKKLMISKRTIYENFKDKDELIRESLDYENRRHSEINNLIIEQSGNIIEAVLMFLKTGSEILSQVNPDYFSDLKRLYPAIWKEKVQESKVYTFNLILGLLKKGKEQGIYLEDINEEIIAMILIEQLFLISDQTAFPPSRYPITEVYENIIISMTRGITTTHGRELLEKHR